MGIRDRPVSCPILGGPPATTMLLPPLPCLPHAMCVYLSVCVCVQRKMTGRQVGVFNLTATPPGVKQDLCLTLLASEVLYAPVFKNLAALRFTRGDPAVLLRSLIHIVRSRRSY